MKNAFTVLRSKGAAIVVVSMAFATQAHAALPAWATSMGSDITTRATDVEAAVGPVVVFVLVAVIGIKLIKRFANKV